MLNTLKIGDFLHRKRIPIIIEPETEYSLVTIKLYHKGVVLRGKKKGALLGSKMYRVSKGDFILSGIDARNGAFGVVPEELDGAIVTNDFWYFDVDEEKVKRDFFYWLTTTPLFLDACQKSSKGETQRIRLQKALFNEFEFHFPPLEQQGLFLETFTSIDDSLSSLSNENKNQSSYLTQLRQAVLQEAIEGKLTADWRKENPVRKGDPDFDAEALLEKIKIIQNKWIEEEIEKGYREAKTIKTKLCKVNKNCVESPKKPITWGEFSLIEIMNIIVDCHNKTAPYTNSGIQILRTTNIKHMNISFKDKRFVSADTYKYWSRRCIPQPGDLIYTREAPVGEIGIIPDGSTVCLGQRLMLIRTFEDLVLRKYILYALSEPQFLERIAHLQKGAFVKHLRVGDVENAVIALPPIAEQQAIVKKVDKFLSMVDNLEKQVSMRKEQTDMLMQSVLREAFEGDGE